MWAMKLLYCDESNMEERAGDFLIYGGVIIDAEKAKALSDAIEGIRALAGIASLERVKFGPPASPLDHQGHRALKQKIIEAAIEHDAILIAYIVLHDVATSPDEARRCGINTICLHFDGILSRTGDPGLVLIDRVPDNKADDLLREKFAVGVRDLPHSPEMRLKNILGFHYSTIGQSHFTSLADILIGSLRFVINAHTRNENQESAMRLLQLLSPLLFRDQGRPRVSELGFAFRPKNILVRQYWDKYQGLQNFLRQGSVDTEQTITCSTVG
jgi:hypothetical protein